MNGSSQATEFVFRVRRVTCMTLIAALVVVAGMPIPETMAQTPRPLRSVNESCPYVNRDTAPARIEELRGRLAERRKAIERTRAMLPGLKAGSREAWAKADRIMSEEPAKLMTSFAGDYLDKTKIMKDSIKKLRKASGMSTEKLKKIDSWLKTMEDLEEAGSFLEKAPTSFQAGTKFGLEHQAEMSSLQNEIVKANKLFVESGLAEELGGGFATAIGGPLGKLAFDAGLTTVDLIVSTEAAFIDADAARQVQSAVDAMEWAYGIDNSEMVNLTALLASNCGKKPEERVAESNRRPEPPPPAVAKKAPVTTAPASAVAGPNIGPILIIGGAAVAGAAALAVGLSGLAGADCGAPPQGFGSAWWVDYSDWCRCEGGTPVVSTTQCVQ